MAYEQTLKKDFENKKRETRQLKKQIDEDSELTPAAKKERKQMLDKELERIGREYRQEVMELRSVNAKDQQRKLFALSNMEARDAVSKVEQIDRDKLASAYRKADSRGDELTKRAIAHRAHVEGNSPLVSEWASENDDRQKQYESMKEAQSDATNGLDVNTQFSTML